jgi:hypothetical protein
MDGNFLLLVVTCVCLIACSKGGEESRVSNEDLHCPAPAMAQFEPWGKSGTQQVCKIKHGAFVAWESGYVHVRGQYDMGQKSGLWRWYDKEGKVIKEVDYSTGSSAETPSASSETK